MVGKSPASHIKRATLIVVTIASLMSGCVSGSSVSHDDDPAAVKRDAGPSLCRDGTAPPCTPRS
jgi:hypothetical protein